MVTYSTVKVHSSASRPIDVEAPQYEGGRVSSSSTSSSFSSAAFTVLKIKSFQRLFTPPEMMGDAVEFKKLIVKQKLRLTRVEVIKIDSRFIFTEDTWPKSVVRPRVKKLPIKLRKYSEKLMHDIELNPGPNVGDLDLNFNPNPSVQYRYINKVVDGYHSMLLLHLRAYGQDVRPESLINVTEIRELTVTRMTSLILQQDQDMDLVGFYLGMAPYSYGTQAVILQIIRQIEDAYESYLAMGCNIMSLRCSFIMDELNDFLHYIGSMCEVMDFYSPQTDYEGFLSKAFCTKLKDCILDEVVIKMRGLAPNRAEVDYDFYLQRCSEFRVTDVTDTFNLVMYGDLTDCKWIAGVLVYNYTEPNLTLFSSLFINAVSRYNNKADEFGIPTRVRFDCACELSALELAARIGSTMPVFMEQMFRMPTIPTLKADLGEESRTFLESIFTKFGVSMDEALHRIEQLASTMTEFKISFDFKKTIESLMDVPLFKKLSETTFVTDFLNSPVGQFLLNFALSYGLTYTLINYGGVAPPIAKVIVVGTLLGFGIDFNCVYNGVKYGVTQVVSIFVQLCSPEEGECEFKEQSLVETKENIMKILLSVLFGQMMGNVFGPDSKAPDEIIRSFFSSSVLFERYKKGAECSVEFMLEFFANFCNAVGEFLNVDFLKKFGVKYPEIVETADQLASLLNKIRHGERRWDYETSEELSAMQMS